MSSYSMLPLSELVSVADTGTWGEEPVAGGGEPVLRSSNIQDFRMHIEECARRTIPTNHAVTKRLADGDIVVTTSSGSPEHIGKCCIFRQPPDGGRYYFSNFTLRLRPRAGAADSRWLFYWLSSEPGRAVLDAMNSTTTGLRNLNRSLYLAQLVPAPPLEDQNRIADILERADAIRRKQREATLLANEFIRSVFLEMFGDPIMNPRGWPLGELRTCIHGIEPGTSTGGEDRPAGPCEWAVLKVSAVSTGRFLPDEHKVVGLIPPSHAVVPGRGDLLMSRANTRELVAAACLVDEERPRVYLPDKLWRVVPRDGVATAEYLRYLLGTERFRSALAKTATGTSGSMLNVSQEKLLAMVAPVPPIDLQRKFGRVVWTTYACLERQRHTLALSKTLLDVLLQKGFRGDLTRSERVD